MTSPFLIVGTPGMGRTEALVLICRQLLDQGERVLVYQSRTATSERFAGATFTTAGSPVELDEETFLLADDAGDFDANDPLLLSACSRRFPRLCLAGDEKGLSGLVGWRGRLRAGADGLLLSPQPFDGDLIGLRVGRDEAFNGPPGRALLSTRHGVELIQLSLFGQS